ncbi:PilZ domain-containing protein [Peredibacter starrii]|uniref:PilZ domain-containing protein n=1 Tax=Peredibacter starrii TaxID=28202 RepID=A0AAX4HVP0_9BACT|nr:PilZ domain-containing protein [Peredibacter starrii]WPU67173.1 PilZ domain-containing protein [Peredibacter starrii]
MRVIKSDSGHLAYQKIFKHLLKHHSRIIVWQVLDSGERVISESRLNSFHLDQGLLNFVTPTGKLDELNPMYCYAEEGQLIFKSGIFEIKGQVMTLNLPGEIKLLEDQDVNLIHGQIGMDLKPIWKTKRIDLDAPEEDESDVLKVKSMAERSSRDQEFLNNEFALSIDEEEAMYADKRESPRARPKKEKWVKVKVDGSPEVHFLKLFDLSRGGIAFVAMEMEKFPKGNTIHVVGFDEFDLDDPLVGKIMSHRPIDETQIEFKVGVKFDEGQE